MEGFALLVLFVAAVYAVLLFAIPFMVYACQRNTWQCHQELVRIRKALEHRPAAQSKREPPRDIEPSSRMVEKVLAADARRATKNPGRA